MQKDWPTLYVIANPDLGYDISRVVRNWNDAIKLTKNKALRKTDYHMIATDGTVYPRDYAQKPLSLKMMDITGCSIKVCETM
jgi:hypothetical protein